MLRTAAAMRQFGADVVREGDGRWRVVGHGALREPDDVVDCGNSGTGVRLMMGAAAGFPLNATFTGDACCAGGFSMPMRICGHWGRRARAGSAATAGGLPAAQPARRRAWPRRFPTGCPNPRRR